MQSNESTGKSSLQPTPGLEAAFRKRPIPRLFHYTHIENVASILKSGVICRAVLVNKEVPFRDISWNTAHHRRRAATQVGGFPLSCYVPLFVHSINPFFDIAKKRVGQDLAALMIGIGVVSQAGVWFSDGNAAYAHKGTRFYCQVDDVKRIPMPDRIMGAWGYNRQRAAEVLILGHVEVRCIRSVYVVDPDLAITSGLLPSGPVEGIDYHRFADASIFRRP